MHIMWFAILLVVISLYFVTNRSEYCKATRGVDDIAIGRYEQAQKRGNSMKL